MITFFVMNRKRAVSAAGITVCLLLLVLFSGSPICRAGQNTAAVLIAEESALTRTERQSLHDLIGRGYSRSGDYQLVDAATMDKMLEDELVKAFIRGEEHRIEEIKKKYQVGLLIRASGECKAVPGIAGYYLATASVSLNAKKAETATLHDIATSDPQSGIYGIPAWVGETKQAARQSALHAAVADVFEKIGLRTIYSPVPVRINLAMLEASSVPSSLSFVSSSNMKTDRAKQLVRDMAWTIGRRDEITAAGKDSGDRLASIAVLRRDIDLQRRRRTDTAEVQLFDLKNRRHIKSFELPRRIAGIRRPDSRRIVDLTFAPSGRFLAALSEHPALWVYDNWSGILLVNMALEEEGRRSVEFSEDCRYLRLSGEDDIATSYYRLTGK